MWEHNDYTCELDPKAVCPHERIMLASGQCPFFFPTAFYSDQDHLTASYSCSGFVPLSTFRIERTDDALYIFEHVLLALRGCIEYLLEPERVRVTSDTVFYCSRTGEVRLAYLPLQEHAPDIRRTLIRFLAELKADLQDDSVSCIDRIARRIYYENHDLRDLLTITGLMRRELGSRTSGASSEASRSA